MNHKVVVTGLGVLTPIGNTVDEYWNSLLEGKSGIEQISSFDASAFSTRIGGEIKNF